MIRAVFLDSDDTLYPHQQKKIPDSAWNALLRLQEKGIAVVLATGRNPGELRKLGVTDFPFDGYIVLNGQLCLDKNFIPYHKVPIEGKEKEYLVSLFEEKRLPMGFCDEDELYINFCDHRVLEAQNDVSSPVPACHEYNGKELLLAMFYLDEEELKELDLSALQVTRWNRKAVDVVAKGGSKYQGILKYMEHYGISQEETMAFGDGENDMEMLEKAGLSIAMGNAPEEVKAVADYVTDDIDEDGILHALEHFGLL